MKRVFILMAMACAATVAVAQKADAAFVVGGSFVSDITGTIETPISAPSATIKTDRHLFLEGALGVRVLNAKLVSLHAELPVAAIPSQGLTINTSSTAFDHLNAVFVTPGIRLKFVPGAPISPWASFGGGFAHYSLDTAGVSQSRGAIQYGGGLDFNTGLPLLGFRAEVRDFVSARPDFAFFSNPFLGNAGFHYHSILAGGGIVLRF
ncbi:MAG TPA: hypothetical protein VKH81_08080 [Candidatus Angelobacter sp.]|nr:hypothetical protein [Candidatus Angelobacter sp.]